jgi:hypothetical protein
MTQRYLRNRNDGFIYDWHPILAANPLCEEVTEEEAYPERFVSEAKRGRPRKVAALDLSTADIPESPPSTPPELAADASRRLPK